jgi:large subunit ribosomal protein L30
VAEKTPKMIRIKWVRSGIGFTYRQKTIVRSLGLNKLNHTVVRPDTPQIRGIVAAVPHLLEIVPEPVAPAWASIPEYTVHASVAAPPAPAESTPGVAPEAAGETVVAAENAVPAKAEAPSAKPAKASKMKETSPEGSETA